MVNFYVDEFCTVWYNIFVNDYSKLKGVYAREKNY